jgi:hypothetical protein
VIGSQAARDGIQLLRLGLTGHESAGHGKGRNSESDDLDGPMRFTPGAMPSRISAGAEVLLGG